MPIAAIVSFRLGLHDGVSVVAAGWGRALTGLGFAVRTMAGEGPVAVCLPGLAMGATTPPTASELVGALADVDLVVVENLCTIPLNLAAARVLARVLRGRPAILHHHDPPWQRPHLAHVTELPPDDPGWLHVTVNRLTQRELADRGIVATTIYNGFAEPPPADREATRTSLGITDSTRLVIHPVRAIPRKNVPAALALAGALDATYWLLGPAEDGYGPELEAVLRRARCPVLFRPSPTGSVHDAYAAADVVAFPSTWEGFGNPPIEAALHRRPAAVGVYPVAQELRTFGFRWFDPGDPAALRQYLSAPAGERAALLDHNRAVAVEHFSEERMAADIERLLRGAGWLP
ncbi:MAG: glycosyltransferase [Acidimicrobiales bacterium]